MVIYQEQELQLKKEKLGARILSQARNELCLHMGYITEEDVRTLAQPLKKNEYGQYLLRLIGDK